MTEVCITLPRSKLRHLDPLGGGRALLTALTSKHMVIKKFSRLPRLLMKSKKMSG